MPCRFLFIWTGVDWFVEAAIFFLYLVHVQKHAQAFHCWILLFRRRDYPLMVSGWVWMGLDGFLNNTPAEFCNSYSFFVSWSWLFGLSSFQRCTLEDGGHHMQCSILTLLRHVHSAKLSASLFAFSISGHPREAWNKWKRGFDLSFPHQNTSRGPLSLSTGKVNENIDRIRDPFKIHPKFINFQVPSIVSLPSFQREEASWALCLPVAT